MQHYGDITKIDGHKVPLVDVVCGGSPCQDLSVAGNRKGLQGERSGLFMEQIRIVKEMRDESAKRLRSGRTAFDLRCIQPRFMVWENVPGAFSSNKGEDFRAVLEEICRVADKTATVPMPKDGRWSSSGCILGDGWSVAWRVHDAQFWGVPQRRKRIALVADFGSESAAEILFERKSVSRDSESSEEKRQSSSATTRESSEDTISFQERAGCDGGGKGILIQHERTGALSTLNNQSVLCGFDAHNILETGNQCQTLTSGRNDTHSIPTICEVTPEIAATLDASYYKGCGERQGVERTVVCIGNGQTAQLKESDKANTLDCMHEQQAVVVYGLDRASFNQGENAQFDFSIKEELAQTLVSKGPGGGTSETVGALCRCDYKGVGNQYVSDGKVIIQKI